MQAGFDGGQVVTKPLLLPVGKLCINATSDWGKIMVEVLDADGKMIEDMSSAPVSANGVHLQVYWPKGKTLAHLTGKPVRLRFTVNNALLYSWKVE